MCQCKAGRAQFWSGKLSFPPLASFNVVDWECDLSESLHCKISSSWWFVVLTNIPEGWVRKNTLEQIDLHWFRFTSTEAYLLDKIATKKKTLPAFKSNSHWLWLFLFCFDLTGSRAIRVLFVSLLYLLRMFCHYIVFFACSLLLF